MLSNEDLLMVIRDQNDLRLMDKKRLLKRTKYLEMIRRTIEDRSIVLVQGPRRCGKTTLLKLMVKDLSSSKGFVDGSVLYLNLEDFRLSSELEIGFFERVVKLHRERCYPSGRLLFLIDEVQNIDGFERYLRTVHDNDDTIKFIVTGSNSKLLSRELGSLLTGRTVSIRLFPFSFGEYLEYKLDEDAQKVRSNDPIVVRTFYDYLEKGGIPEYLEISKPHDRLREYLDQVLFRDIMSRFGLRNERLLKDLTYFLTIHSSSRVSITQMSRTFGVSKDTVTDYLSFLEQSYLMNLLKAYSRSLKDRIRRPSKVYSMDPGLINSLQVGSQVDSGSVLETVVYLKLLTSGMEIYYYLDPTTGAECDFLLKDGLTVMDILQVTRGSKDPKTIKREVSGLVKAAKDLGLKNGRIINLEREGTETADGITIKYQLFTDFLLNE